MAKVKRKVQRKPRRTTSEKVMIVLGILIALSMVLSLFVGLGARSRSDNDNITGALYSEAEVVAFFPDWEAAATHPMIILPA